MDDLLASILENNTTDPERLALAARIADHYRQAKSDELRAKEVELRNNEVQREALKLKLKEKELDLGRPSAFGNGAGISKQLPSTISLNPSLTITSGLQLTQQFPLPRSSYPQMPTLPSHAPVPPQFPLQSMPGPPLTHSSPPWTHHYDALLALGLEDFGHASMPTMDYFGSQAGMQSRGMGPLAHPTLNDPSGMNAGMMGLSGYPDPLTVRPSLGLPQPMGRGNFPLQSDMRSSVPPPFYDQFAPDGILAQLPVQPLSHPPASAPMMPYAAAAASMYKSPSGYADMDVDIDPSLYPRRRDTPTASPSIASSSSMSPGRRGSDPQGDASRRPHDRPGAEAAAPAEPVAPVSKPRKKPILEEDAVCSRCNRFLGVLLLHTPNAATSPIQSPATQPYTVGIVCQTCDPTACAAAVVQSNQVGGLVPGSKKRGAGGRENDCVACEVCKRVAGVGGVRVIEGWKESRDTPRHGVRSGSGDRFGQTPILGDGEPDFGVEFVCESCRSKYALCTECGGGGKYRTGKWRPVGLFLPGRRTCRLPHVRIGSSPITFRSYCLPESLGSNPTERASILQDIERHVPAMYYHRLAVPEVMEIPPPNGLSTWENLEERVRIRCERLRELILEDSVERKFGLRRYFGGAWVERVNRHARKERKERKGTSSKSAGKGTSKAKESDDGGGPNRGGGGRSRSTKKGSDGDVKASFSDSPLLPPPISTNTPGQDPLVMVGMLTLLWCRPGGIVWITAFQGLNTEFSASGVMFRLCRRMVETVIAEYRKEEQRAKDEGVTIPDCKECTLNMDTNPNPKYAPPIHSIGLPVFEEFASLPGVSHTLRRLGFLPMDEYIRQHPELDREIFDRAVRDPEGVYGGKTDYRRSFFLAGIKSILSGPWGKESSSGPSITGGMVIGRPTDSPPLEGKEADQADSMEGTGGMGLGSASDDPGSTLGVVGLG